MVYLYMYISISFEKIPSFALKNKNQLDIYENIYMDPIARVF